MLIAGLEYNLERKCLEIYFTGCKSRICPNCQNPELWDFENALAKDYHEWYDKIEEKINSALVEELWLLGGEPLDQDIEDLHDFLNFLSKHDKKIWLWTRYDIEQIPDKIKPYFYAVKSGCYDEKLPPYFDSKYGIKLASNNQKIYRLRKGN